jgi:hypothetical protein
MTISTLNNIVQTGDFLPGQHKLAGFLLADWPVAAQEWITRQRMNGWPSESFLSQVRNLPIYVVPVGNRQSGQYYLEWRLSFISIEREGCLL